ncbi:MAG TPA: DUF2937 family protein [Steroidobacteraceae bacterium]|jgi:hypothetical protein
MKFVRAILDRIVLLAAVLAAGCIPSFIVQYRQRTGGRLDQVLADLAPFQEIANRSHNGSLTDLIHYHLQSGDATFHQEGSALQSMVDSAARLRAMLAGLDTDLVHQCSYLLGHYDSGLVRATWGSYQPGFTLDLQSVVFALALGVLVWAVFLGLWHGIAALARLGADSEGAEPKPRPVRRRIDPRLH